jgi:hypothetical protein
MPPRLAEIIHRAIPKPVILIHADEAGGTASLSLAPKRAAEREAGRVVTISVHDSGMLTHADAAFVSSLALSTLPTRDLAALYAGLIERVEALAAARLADRPFRLAHDGAEVERWRTTLARDAELTRELAAQSALAAKESRLPRRVELGEAASAIKKALDKNRASLK